MISESKIIVRYQETDQMGIAHHSVYPVWFEVARTDFIKKLGVTYSEIEKMGVMLPLTEVTCKYYKGTRYEDELTVTARVLSVSPSRMTFGYQVFLPGEKRPVSEGTTSHGFVDSVLELVCAVWLIRLGRSWTHKGEYRLPGRSMTPAVLGTAVFYWGVLSRFMENSSSWHRVEPTAMVWQMLAALVFLSAMVRALWLPETSNGRQLCEAGICTFLLCFCWELPRVLVLLFYGITAADLPEVLFGFGMCCIGALGLFTVARVAGSDGRPAIPRHAVG